MSDLDTTQTAAEEPVPQEVAAPELSGFRSQLPEDLREDPSLESIKDIEGLAKSYVNAQRMLGSSIRLPSGEADENTLNEFYQKLENVPGVGRLPDPDDAEGIAQLMNRYGRPEDADGYSLQFDDDVAPHIDQGLLTEYKQIAHKLGLPAKTAQALAQFQVEKVQQQEEAFIQQGEQTQQVLKQMWGDAHETNIARAQAALRQYSDQFPDAAQQIDQMAYYNPVLMSMLAQIGADAVEAPAVMGNEGNTGFGPISPSEARERITEIKSSEDYRRWVNNPMDPSVRHIADKLEHYHSLASR